METLSTDYKPKHYLMLCELHNPFIHGKDSSSDPNIEMHYLVYDRFDSLTGISLNDMEDETAYDTDREYDSDSEDDYEENTIERIEDSILFLKRLYSKLKIAYSRGNIDSHPTIRNYTNIIINKNYIKPEIGEYIILPSQEAIAILKTFWLRIIQKKWKKVYKERKNIIKQRCYLSNLSLRTINGTWPKSCSYLPGLKGMLSDLRR